MGRSATLPVRAALGTQIIRIHGLEAPCYVLREVIIHIKIPNRTPVCIHIIADDEGRIGIVEDVESDVEDDQEEAPA